MTDSPSEIAAEAAPTAAVEMAERFAGLVGSATWSADLETAIVTVDPAVWVEAHRAVVSQLPFYSFLSAVDWAAEVAVGEPVADEETAERYQVISRVSAIDGPDALILSTSLDKDDPVLPTLTAVYPGADWHEREAAEMFGIRFDGHPNPVSLYLPDGFEGHPMRKTYRLMSREVKPWPGDVDVEGLPSTENPEA